MKYRKATIDDIKNLSEIRKKQLIDEGSYPDKDIDQNFLSASKMEKTVYLKFGFKESDEWLQMDTFK